MRTAFGLLLLSSLPVAIALADSYGVNPDGTGDFPSIQAAIIAASDGDEIVLADGVYVGPGNRDIDFLGKAIVVRSGSDNPAACVIDCQGSSAEEHRGLVFQSGEGPGTLLRGVTVKNGYLLNSPGEPDDWGGGALIWGSSPTLENCHFLENSAGAGGGIACYRYASPTITGCVFAENETEAPIGGGIYCAISCSPSLSGCSFTANAHWGVYFHIESSPVLISCNISANEDGGIGFGGGGALEIHDCDIFMNDGPALHGTTSSAVISECRIWGNTAEYGAAIYCNWEFYPTITECIFYDNTAEQSGAVVHSAYESPELHFANCTLVGNAAGNGAIADCSIGQITFENTIIAFNSSGEAVRGSALLSCCDLFGNAGGDWIGDIADQYGENGNISADPLFCDFEGGDFTLHEDSPCAPFSSPNPECDLIGALLVGCGPTPTQRPTWGGLKALFRSPAR